MFRSLCLFAMGRKAGGCVVYGGVSLFCNGVDSGQFNQKLIRGWLGGIVVWIFLGEPDDYVGRIQC